jgi:hypothetical protein
VKRRLLRFLRLAERPDPPPGAGPSLLTFRASRRHFYLQAAGWGLRQLAALVGIVVSLIFLGFFETTAFDLPASRALDKVAERFFRMSWVELQAKVAEVWPWVVAVETVAITAFVVGLWLSWTVLRLDWEARWYMVSDECLRIREGLFRTHERTMTVANIQNLSVRRGPLQKLLGIADLEVQTAGGGAASGLHGHRRPGQGTDLHVGRFRGVDDAEALRDRIHAALLRHRDSGLGDPDELVAAAPVADEPVAVAAPAASGGLDAAAAELLAESRRLRAAVAAALG